MIPFTIFHKELRAYFGSFLAYAILAVALALSGFFFYTDLTFFILWGGVDLPRGLWQYFFHDLRFVFLLLLPVLTARLLAEEKRLGTLDLLWTYPVREGSVLAGKFLSALLLLVVVLTLTLLYPLFLSVYYPSLEWQPLVAGYVGLFLLGAAFASVGLFLSSLTDSQAVAAMGTFGVLVLFWFITWNEQAIGEVLLQVLLQVSLFDRFYNFARGVIDSREITFFLIFAFFFLVFTWQSLRSRRWRGAGGFSSLRAFFTTPSRRQWLGVAAADLVLAGILIAAQAVAIRHNVRWDLTPGKRLTLSAQTREILHNLTQEVSVTVFFGGRPDTYQDYEDLLKRYAAESSYFRYRILHRDRNLGLAQRYGVTHYGETVVEYDDQHKVLALPSEELITTALFQLTHKEKKTIYFLTGHGENDPFSTQGTSGYSAARVALENENFEVKTLDLGREKEVPADVEVVIVSGPRTDLLEEELEKLKAFIRRGGCTLFMMDPPVSTPHLTRFLSEYGVMLTEDVVYDPENRLMGGDAYSPIISLYNTAHPIVRNFRVNTLFSLARSVRSASQSEGSPVTATPFAQTSPGSWARLSSETSETVGAMEFEGGKAQPGPVPVAVAVTIRLNGKGEEGTPEARLVVYGDGDFASNALLSLLGNRDLFLNTIRWLTGEERLITLRPRDEEVQPRLSPLYLTARQSRLLFWLVVVGEPALVLLVGAVVSGWRKRRR